MTTEPEYTAPAPFPEAGFVVFGIPGVPYSSIHLPLVWDINQFNILVASAMESAKLVKEAFDETFGQQQSAPEPQRVPIQQPQHAPQQRGTRPADELDPELVVTGNCPDHGCAAHPSILKYQEIEMGDDGAERYAKYWCPGKDNGTGKNHSLYARQLV